MLGFGPISSAPISESSSGSVVNVTASVVQGSVGRLGRAAAKIISAGQASNVSLLQAHVTAIGATQAVAATTLKGVSKVLGRAQSSVAARVGAIVRALGVVQVQIIGNLWTIGRLAGVLQGISNSAVHAFVKTEGSAQGSSAATVARKLFGVLLHYIQATSVSVGHGFFVRLNYAQSLVASLGNSQNHGFSIATTPSVAILWVQNKFLSGFQVSVASARTFLARGVLPSIALSTTAATVRGSATNLFVALSASVTMTRSFAKTLSALFVSRAAALPFRFVPRSLSAPLGSSALRLLTAGKLLSVVQSNFASRSGGLVTSLSAAQASAASIIRQSGTTIQAGLSSVINVVARKAFTNLRSVAQGTIAAVQRAQSRAMSAVQATSAGAVHIVSPSLSAALASGASTLRGLGRVIKTSSISSLASVIANNIGQIKIINVAQATLVSVVRGRVSMLGAAQAAVAGIVKTVSVNLYVLQQTISRNLHSYQRAFSIALSTSASIHQNRGVFISAVQIWRAAVNFFNALAPLIFDPANWWWLIHRPPPAAITSGPDPLRPWLAPVRRDAINQPLPPTVSSPGVVVQPAISSPQPLGWGPLTGGFNNGEALNLPPLQNAATYTVIRAHSDSGVQSLQVLVFNLIRSGVTMFSAQLALTPGAHDWSITVPPIYALPGDVPQLLIPNPVDTTLQDLGASWGSS